MSSEPGPIDTGAAGPSSAPPGRVVETTTAHPRAGDHLSAFLSAADRSRLASLPRIAGQYRIIRQIGEGGMGVVYLAEQSMPKRQVALKALRPGAASRGLLDRFMREAHILGRLHHPGIAQIYEAGIADEDATGRAYIVIEYVDGPPINEYADQRSLTRRERLELFIRVCDAVHHAHVRRVIHRDLKPHNVLVDVSGQPKVLDFGIARFESTDDTTKHVTHDGALLGTPAYMSPEQIGRGEVDTRSDVYSLGVMLFQLLTGELPHDLTGKSLGDVIRIVQLIPPRRASTIDRTLAGDLDAIIGVALRTDPAERYQGADQLASDLRRHLTGQPIQARQDSALYVLMKQIQRRRAPFVAGLVILLAIIASSVTAMVSAQRERALAYAADNARRDAETQSQLAVAAQKSLQNELRVANIERGGLEAAIGNLPFAEDIVWQAYFEDPTSPAAKWGLWSMYHRNPVLWTTQLALKPTASAIGLGRVYVGSRAGEMSRQDPKTGKEISQRSDLGGGVNAIALGPPGLVVAGLSSGATVIVPDATTEPVRALATGGSSPTKPDPILSVAWSPDGRWIAAGGQDRTVRLWDAHTGTLVRSWIAHANPVGVVAFSSNSSLLASAGLLSTNEVGSVRVWKTEDGSSVVTLPVPRDYAATALQFTQNDTQMVVGFRDRTTWRFDLSTSKGTVINGLFSAPVAAVVEAPKDNAVLLVGGEMSYIYNAGSDVPSITMPRTRYRGLAGGWIDAETVVIVCDDGVARAMSTRREPSLTRIDTGYASWCFDVGFSLDGKLLAIGAQSRLEILRSGTYDGAVSVPLEPADTRTRCVKFIPGSGLLLAGSLDGAMRIIDPTSAEILAVMPSTAGEVYSLDVDPTGRLAAAGHMRGVTWVWDLTTREVVAELPRAERRIEGVRFSPDGKTLVSTGPFRGVQVWDVASQSMTRTLVTAYSPWCAAFSPDGGTLAITTHAGTLELFETRTWTKSADLRGHGRLIPGLTYSPDGTMFATGSEDGILRLWDVKTNRSVLSLEPRGNEIVGIAFDPTGRYLAAATANRFAAVFDLQSMDRCVEGNKEFHRTRLGIDAPVTPAAKP